MASAEALQILRQIQAEPSNKVSGSRAALRHTARLTGRSKRVNDGEGERVRREASRQFRRTASRFWRHGCSHCASGLRRLRGQEPAMGVGLLRRLHVPRVQRSPPRPGRPHQLCAVRALGATGSARVLHAAWWPTRRSWRRCRVPGLTPVPSSLNRSVTMDAWNPDQLKKMQCGGNAKLNAFLKQYGIEKSMDIAEKYNSRAAEVSEPAWERCTHGRALRLNTTARSDHEPSSCSRIRFTGRS